MSQQYQAVGWNRQKRLYDLAILAGVLLYLALFIGLGAILFPYATAETLVIRAAGSAAFLLLKRCLVHRTTVPARFAFPATSL